MHMHLDRSHPTNVRKVRMKLAFVLLPAVISPFAVAETVMVFSGQGAPRSFRINRSYLKCDVVT